VRLTYLDEADGSAQFCRAYLPTHYSASKRWPLMLELHGFNPANPVYGPIFKSTAVTAKSLRVELQRFDVRTPGDLTAAFGAMANARVDAVLIAEDGGYYPFASSICELAIKQRLPSISFIEYADAGGLFGYGPNVLALYRRAAVFVDKILKGAKPADLPIERPTTFEFVINMKTAKALGLAVSTATRMRADREIE